MLLLDWALQFILSKRTHIRNKKSLALLKMKKNAATLEWQIEEAKTGKKTNEEWQEKLNQMEKTLELERDNFNQQITILHENISSQSNLLAEQNTLNDDLKKKYDNLQTTTSYYSEINGQIERFYENLIYENAKGLNTVQIQSIFSIFGMSLDDVDSTEILQDGNFSLSDDDRVKSFLSFLVEIRLLIRTNKTSYNLSGLGKILSDRLAGLPF